ncbi:MAG: hypothetical protein ACK5PS_04535 [Desulfopila sp.]
MKSGWLIRLICWQLLVVFSLLPGVAAAGDGQPPSLQLSQQQPLPPEGAAQRPPAVLHDIHGPMLLPEPVPYLLYSLIGLTALALFLALYWWFFRRRAPLASPVPPEIIARNDLLLARELMTTDQALLYMERLAEILRQYLEARFGLDTIRQTTREFLQTMAEAPPRPLAGFTAELQACLERCDMAKFAHKGEDVGQLQAMEDSILHLVNSIDQASSPHTTGDRR